MVETKNPTPATPAPTGKTRILVVEDERPLAHALELKLTHEGYDVTVAMTGAEGLKQALAGGFKLMLLDMILPELDGFGVLEGLKGKVQMPIVVLSNLGQSEDLERAKSLGAVDYLVKSNVPLKSIVAKVHEILGDAPAAEETPTPAPAPAPETPAEEAAAAEPAAEPEAPTEAPADDSSTTDDAVL